MAAAIERTEALLEAAKQDSDGQAGHCSSRLSGDPFAGESEEEKVGLVAFTLSHRQFALDIRYVCEIISKARVSPLPGMPPHVCGVYDLRGQLLPAFDLSGLLDLARQSSIGDWAIVCGQSHPEFLILSEVAPEILTLPVEDIRATEPGSDADAWQRATTKAGAVVLDGSRLLNDRRFFLEDEGTIIGDETERTET
jgi:purine-binding chemotaxis protein CheW